VTSVTLLETGQKLKTFRDADGIIISLPTTAPDPVATVIKLEVKGHVACTQFD
jgi:alpha-L-fucosidase